MLLLFSAKHKLSRAGNTTEAEAAEEAEEVKEAEEAEEAEEQCGRGVRLCALLVFIARWWRRRELNPPEAHKNLRPGQDAGNQGEWWRRRELNPRPKSRTAKSLHVCPVLFVSPGRIRNRQEAGSTSPRISPGGLRRQPPGQPTKFTPRYALWTKRRRRAA